jgi:hypothetical protein
LNTDPGFQEWREDFCVGSDEIYAVTLDEK